MELLLDMKKNNFEKYAPSFPAWHTGYLLVLSISQTDRISLLFNAPNLPTF